jgi:hypothetical protein
MGNTGKPRGAVVVTPLRPVARSRKVRALTIIEVCGCARAQALGDFFSVGFVGLLHEQAGARRPGAAEIRVFRERGVKHRNWIAAIEPNELKRIVISVYCRARARGG